MGNGFLELAFTPAVLEAQERFGSRAQYARLQRAAGTEAAPDPLFAEEAEFIGQRDGFYLATVGEGGQPYVQFRGGPAGFLRVLDERTLGYADFRGNAQYISTGNLAGNDRAAIILMDYAARRRLKLFVRVEVRDAAADPELTARLRLPDYPARVERAVLLHVQAYDWNCPQHITPRFTADEVERAAEPMRRRIAELEAEVALLRGARPGEAPGTRA